jgi:Icc-related predicted phosphoesterase
MTQRILSNLNNLLFRKIDIVVTHAPIRNIHDKEHFVHQGFEVFHKIIKYFKPKLWIHGHIHLDSHHTIQESKVGETKIINAYGYKVIEFIKE